MIPSVSKKFVVSAADRNPFVHARDDEEVLPRRDVLPPSPGLLRSVGDALVDLLVVFRRIVLII